MKKVKIEIGNAEAINEALAEVNGKAWRYTITDSSKIMEICDRAEAMLDRYGIPKSRKPGCVVHFESASSTFNSSYSSPVTSLTVKRTRAGWVLRQINKIYVSSRRREQMDVQLTQQQQQYAVEQLRSTFANFRDAAPLAA